MPPAIEVEEEEEYGSFSEHAASSPRLAGDGDDAAMEDFSDEPKQPLQQNGRWKSPDLVVSDIPLVISDIPDAVATPTLQHQPSDHMEKGSRMNSKRKASPQRTSQRPTAKRRKGPKRDIPCAYCIRRLANNPGWSCTEALVNQAGEPNYTGTRCSACVSAHVSCIPVPPQAIPPVTILVKAAQEVRTDGTKDPALLAAYEAAIGPALRSIIGAGLPPSDKMKRRSMKSSADRKTGKGAAGVKLPSRQAIGADSKTTRPRHGHERPALERGHTDRHHHHRTYQQHAAPDTVTCQASQHPPFPSANDPEVFERVERQALRRRKVEALESLAHTAALFLAEFMDFRKGQASGPRADPGAGNAYAAAAAGIAAQLFRPDDGEIGAGWDGGDRDGVGGEQPGRFTNSEDSTTDSEDDEDIPARVVPGDADSGEYDSSEEARSDVSGGLKEGSEANQEEPNVKVEGD